MNNRPHNAYLLSSFGSNFFNLFECLQLYNCDQHWLGLWLGRERRGEWEKFGCVKVVWHMARENYITASLTTGITIRKSVWLCVICAITQKYPVQICTIWLSYTPNVLRLAPRTCQCITYSVPCVISTSVVCRVDTFITCEISKYL